MRPIKLVKYDPWLSPHSSVISSRHDRAVLKEAALTGGGRMTLSEFASGYMYFGIHRTDSGWTIREHAPNATNIFLVGDFNMWQEREEYRLQRLANGVFEIILSEGMIRHGDHYKLKIYWNGGCGERIPAWTNRTVQDSVTGIFSAQVWMPDEPYRFSTVMFKPDTAPLLIYECHVGMSTEGERVSSYAEFTEQVLPRVKAGGYNCIQVMAIQEHPYYGSFGYHVSGFFAPSSRFGTPDELKALVDTAHRMGIAVIMDIVHSHAVRNENEGLALLDGNPAQYFHGGSRREHPAWGSLCFDYGKDEVLHFLLSNCKYWIEEYLFDGFRFDGVTSMIYYSHGLGEDFTSYDHYYNGRQDEDAITYLTLANKMIHEINRNAVTIAEEVSGMPGLTVPVSDGGYGFDYRMAMNIPDFWVKMTDCKRDEDWLVSDIWREMTSRRSEERTVSYAESHDQALVGGKTIIFRLIDAAMYNMMSVYDNSLTVDRGIALHKMIRLVTVATVNGAYLNFMGNEFGHPEWIDFPREGNGWSYHYARRQWSLVDDECLKYRFLGDFDRSVMHFVGSVNNFQSYPLELVCCHDGDQILAFRRAGIVFVFNFNPSRSFTDYGILVPDGKYLTVINTDSRQFGGFGLADDSVAHFSVRDDAGELDGFGWLRLYIPARTAVALRLSGK
ncbi:MAG: alpha amylase C-terminal domain-containing protein [Dysgonamonadaceae bacterium]|jgi:1,4-alpha-glucan branching enzyme|nr:alpha amylase C-terminal domain-containing protein [Dysgonamonadaceae bacterium]